MSRLRAAFYGDGLTGGIDALLQFARRGWSGRLFVGLPDSALLESAAARSDVVGLAGVGFGRALDRLDAPVYPVGSPGLSLAIDAAGGAGAAPLPIRTDTAGPVLALSGSPQTRRQMDAATAADWFVQPLELDASRAASQLDWVLSALRAGRSVGLTSDHADTTDPEGPTLEAIAQAAAAIAAGAAAARTTRRLIVCGDELSGRVARLLGVESLSVAANPWGDVALLRAHAPAPAVDGLELLLTDGRAGGDDLFVRVRGTDA